MFESLLSITTRSITYFEYYTGERRKSDKPFNPYLRNLSNNFSKRSYKRLKLAIDTLIDTAKFKTVFVSSTQKYFRYKVNFITLTLPSLQIHSDDFIVKQILTPFLHAWRNRRPGLLYVWKAETQDNGNIHFHITSNSFYHYKKLREHWNRYLNRLGYVDRATTKNPNSTDVHSVSKIKNLSSYLASYLTKKDLYTKTLKRYFRRYRKQMLDQKNTVWHLPKKYFQFLKRKISSTRWGASKPLLTPKLVLSPRAPDIKEDLDLLYLANDYMLKSQYSSTLFLDHSIQLSFPAFFKHWKKQFEELLKLQAAVKDYEVIEAL